MYCMQYIANGHVSRNAAHVNGDDRVPRGAVLAAPPGQRVRDRAGAASPP